jgi:uncharacterized DUF497 family protein
VKATFDPAKRSWTLRERNLDFADADEMFAGRHTVLPDNRYRYGESRYISAGYLRGRMVVVVWTQRGEARHVISMRHCHEKEEKRWHKELSD